MTWDDKFLSDIDELEEIEFNLLGYLAPIDAAKKVNECVKTINKILYYLKYQKSLQKGEPPD